MCQWQKIALQTGHKVSPPTAFDCFNEQRAKRSRKPYATGHDPLEDADDNPLRNILFIDKAYFMFAVMCNCRKWAGQKPHSILNS
jgi:hypothetical protein